MGHRVNFKVGPEYVNFGRVKVGDSFMTTVTKSYVAFLVKGGGTPTPSQTPRPRQNPPARNQAA